MGIYLAVLGPEEAISEIQALCNHFGENLKKAQEISYIEGIPNADEDEEDEEDVEMHVDQG